MKKYLIIIFLLIPIIANAGGGIKYFLKGTFEKCDADANEIIINSIDKSVNCDDEKNEYYADLLINMQEPSLLERAKSKQGVEIYRFFKEPTFHDMVCIRIEIDNSGKATLYKKIMQHDTADDKGNIINGKLISNSNKRILIKDMKPLLKQMDDIKLWELKSADFPIYDKKNKIFSTDGSTYFFEHVKNNVYQTFIIPVPNYGSIDNKIFYKLAQSFIDLAG
jgi:hypothetical protein